MYTIYVLKYNIMYKTKNTIAAGKFRSQCLKMLDLTYETKNIWVITKHGKAVAELRPLEESPVSIIGKLEGTVRTNEDITKPLNIKWNATE